MAGDDGKRLGACGKRLRVAFHFTKWSEAEGGAGGRTGPRVVGAVGVAGDFFHMLGSFFGCFFRYFFVMIF